MYHEQQMSYECTHLKKSQRFLNRTIPPGRRGRIVAFDLRDLLMTHIGKVAANEFDRPLVELLEVVWGVSDLVRLVAQPTDHVENADEKFLLLFLRIRVVITQISNPIVLL